MKTAIVLGATGLVGSALIKELSHSSHVQRIVAITRKPVNYHSEKIHNQVVDFERLEDITGGLNGDVLFSCLGTTLKQAGSVEAQRKVDLDYQLQIAQMADICGVRAYFLVSSSGANSRSNSAYFKMKGELEQAVQQLSFARIRIFQPSLLLGKRNSFRLGEYIGSVLLPVLCLLPGLSRYRPIRGEQVAKKMLQIATLEQDDEERIKVYELLDVFPRGS